MVNHPKMSTSKSANALMTRTFLSLAIFLGLVGSAFAQDVRPSNSSAPAPLSGVNLQLRLTNVNPDRVMTRYTVAPLTTSGGLNRTSRELDTWNIEGIVTLTNSDNANSISRGDIALVSCEQDPDSTFTPNEVVTAVANHRPKAIVLYTTRAVTCTLNGSFGYDSIYSIIATYDAAFLRMIMSSMTRGVVQGQITAETTSGGWSNGRGGQPTTSVAMSILYSITGLITVLFIIIIGSGAIRAHRNPERYGPRRAIGGRPRQSRAKGLARAMLETIPIVKFGDPEPAKPGSERDIELAGTDNQPNKPAETTATGDANKVNKSENKGTASDAAPTAAGTTVASGLGQAESVKSSGENTTGGDGELGCSICTEDFVAGEDVRLLPCRHKYHPACVDPWLLNVSGTCPLCRLDLNPEAATDGTNDATTTDATATDLPPPLGQTGEGQSEATPRARNRISRFLDLHRLRTATPDERIAALRQLREESRAEGTIAAEPQTEEPATRNRLRDRLRLNRRSHQNAPAETPASEAPVAPTGETMQNAART